MSIKSCYDVVRSVAIVQQLSANNELLYLIDIRHYFGLISLFLFI